MRRRLGQSKVRYPFCAFAAVALTLGASPSIAFGQTTGGAPAAGGARPSGQWASELQALGRLLDRRAHEAECDEHCYVLDRLRISGSVEAGSLDFELTGAVLADGAVAVPLFGPPSEVRIDEATEGRGPARIGFEGDAYYLFTDARSFTVTGRLVLQNDLAITIPGPLNRLEADLTDGRLVEGSRLSGLAATTVHFERGSGDAEPDQPTVFQLSRAIRVGREIGFEYRLVLRSGNDLGVVRLPLPHGEEVLEVDGSQGWRVEEGALVLPTAGRTAQVTVRGTLSEVGRFGADERSSYEWWLFESDPEHRLRIEGEPRQFDVGESPIPRSQPAARLFMVQRGQQLEVAVDRLPSAEVLGAVVRQHSRTVVLTQRGDLVAEDRLDYENNGVDYLVLAPQGRAIYLATDGTSERILHKAQGAEELMIPLQTGAHKVRLQTLSQAKAGLLGGRLALPTPTYPLTASRAAVTVGLPEDVHPVAAFGGDRIRWFVGLGDAAAVLFALLLAWFVLHRRRGWLLGGAVLGGLWFLSAPLYVLACVVTCVAALIWVLSRLLSGGKLVAAVVGLAGLAFMVGLPLLLATFAMGGAERSAIPAAVEDDWVQRESTIAASGGDSAGEEGYGTRRRTEMGNRMAQVAVGGVLEGVTPVALPLPGYHRSVTVRRELVAEGRPFEPVVYYVTTWALLPLGLAWLLCLGLLLFWNGREIRDLLGRARRRIDRGTEAPPRPSAAPEKPAPAPEKTDD